MISLGTRGERSDLLCSVGAGVAAVTEVVISAPHQLLAASRRGPGAPAGIPAAAGFAGLGGRRVAACPPAFADAAVGIAARVRAVLGAGGRGVGGVQLA